MIYNYEAEMLRYINRCIPAIKLATYASEEDLLTGLDKVKEYPAFYYSRQEYSLVWNKPIVVPATFEHPYTYSIYPYDVSYIGTILVENQAAAFRLAATLKLYINNNPYIWISIPGISNPPTGEQEKVRVALRLTNIKIEDVRLPNDKNGACRAVKFYWTSQMVINNVPKSPEGIVEEVHCDYELVEPGHYNIGTEVPETEKTVVYETTDNGFKVKCKEHIN